MSKTYLLEGEKIAKESIIKLFLLSLIKGAAGIFTGMTVIVADAVSTLADTLGIFAAYIGLKLSRRTADSKFEYGYYKIETFAAFLISLGIIYVGYVILIDSIESFTTLKPGSFYAFGILATLISIIASIMLSKKLAEAGAKVNSLALTASAKDKRTDVFASFGVLLSIVANYLEIPYIEGTISSLIALIILKEGISSAKESLFFLLDYWDDPKLYKQIHKIFEQEKDLVLEVKKLRLRRAGTFIFGEAFIKLNPFAELQDLREELEILQRKILELNPYFKDFSIYTSVPKSEKIRVAVPIKKGTTLNSELAPNLKSTNAYLFAEIRNNKIHNSYIKKLSKEDKKPVELANFLKKEKVNILIDNNLNSLLYYNLRRTNHILIYPQFGDVKNASDTLKLLLLDT